MNKNQPSSNTLKNDPSVGDAIDAPVDKHLQSEQPLIDHVTFSMSNLA